MIILGIETSCDETAAAIVRLEDDKGQILSNMVLSQLEEHQAFGGVVPEIAARAHMDHLHTLIHAALTDAKLDVKDLNAVAATAGPGLIGGVIVGMVAAKAMASALNIPFIGVNHLEGHALTPRLTDHVEFPYLLLLVSGGHTQILEAQDVGTYKQLGSTLDDACGECFDKSAKLMGLPYPGGPHIEKIAKQCKSPAKALDRFPLPRPLLDKSGAKRNSLDFSFSGLKTAVRNHVESLPAGDLKRTDIADLAYALQHTITDILSIRIDQALSQTGLKTLVVSGGVAANHMIRKKLEDTAKNHGAQLFAPPLDLCGDNAAMIAWAGLERLRRGEKSPLDIKAKPRWPLDEKAA